MSPRRARLSSCAPLSRHPALPAVFVCRAVTNPKPSSSKQDTYLQIQAEDAATCQLGGLHSNFPVGLGRCRTVHARSVHA